MCLFISFNRFWAKGPLGLRKAAFQQLSDPPLNGWRGRGRDVKSIVRCTKQSYMVVSAGAPLSYFILQKEKQ